MNLKQVEALAEKAVATTVTKKTSEESVKPPAAPAGGYFNFLGGKSEAPSVPTPPAPAPKAPAPVVKAPAPAPVEAPASGGFFSFLQSSPGVGLPPPKVDNKEKVTAVPVVKAVSPPVPVAKAPVAPSAPSKAPPAAPARGGGFFSFLESDPTLAPVVAKTAQQMAASKASSAPKVVEKVVEESSSNQRQFSVPTIAQARSEASKGPSERSAATVVASKPTAPAAARGGMFDFLKPVDNDNVSAPVVIAPKAVPVVAPKAPAPAPAPKVRHLYVYFIASLQCYDRYFSHSWYFIYDTNCTFVYEHFFVSN